MVPKVFITGVTGYIGGDLTHALTTAHPDWTYTFLIRSKSSVSTVSKAYPTARIILGDLDFSSTLTHEAANADIVVHTADSSDHEGSARALVKGLVQGHSKKRPGYYLHTSGTGILTYEDADAERYGEKGERVWDDWEGVGELTGLPDHAFHRNVDKVVLEAGIEHKDVLKTAIVCPPTIYGTGRGPISQRSRQVPGLAYNVLKFRKAPILGAGKTLWNNVHVHDLSTFFVLLAEAAASGLKANDAELWGAKGYFIIENGEHVWGELSKKIAEKAAEKEYIEKPETWVMSKDEAGQLGLGFQAMSWGLNSRARAIRARKLLGWEPVTAKLEDVIGETLDVEWERLKKGV